MGPDEGDVDFVKAMMVYKEVGYAYNLQPDHVPQSPGDTGGEQYFTFCYGYIRALIQAVDQMADAGTDTLIWPLTRLAL